MCCELDDNFVHDDCCDHFGGGELGGGACFSVGDDLDNQIINTVLNYSFFIVGDNLVNQLSGGALLADGLAFTSPLGSVGHGALFEAMIGYKLATECVLKHRIV